MQNLRNSLGTTLRSIGRRSLGQRTISLRAIGIGWTVLASAAAVAQTAPPTVAPTELPDAPRTMSFQPGVKGSLLYSDNIRLAGPGAEQNGFIAEVSPYFRGSIKSPRLTGEVDMSLRSFVRTESDDSWLKANLNARGTMALAGNWLWLDAKASVADVSALPFGTMS
ncbi:MAG: hypothetical protein K0B16_15930, partial [Burkholderiaceae bacterium]|nr:hypothetical protein [Burkholderiaceae bacterium]